MELNFIGIALAFGSAIFSCFYLLGLEKFFLGKYPPIKVSFWALSMSCFAGLANLCLTSGEISNPSYILICVLSAILLGSGNVLFNYGIKYLSSYKASFVGTLELVFSILISSIIFKYSIESNFLIGTILIISSIILAKIFDE